MAKTVLITGCSSGIGRATAEAFLEDEWTVWATAREESDLADLAEAGCRTASLDVTDPAACEAVVDDVLDRDGRIDCLVNNAGVAHLGPLEDVSTETLEDQFDVTVFGPHRLVRAALPAMRERGDGTVVNVSSFLGALPTPGSGAYTASKAALESASDALRAEVEDFGIDVVVVQPGFVATGFTDRAVDRMVNGDGAGSRTADYDWLYEVYEDAGTLAADGVLSIPPRAVALTIRDAALASDPDPRYPVGEFAKIALFATYLPDRWRDLGFRLARKLA